MADLHTGFIVIRLAAEKLHPARFAETRDLRALAGKAGASELSRVLNEYPQCTVEPVVSSVPFSRIFELEQEAAKRGHPVTTSLTSYWRIDAKRVEEPERLLDRLTQVDIVEHGYQELGRNDPAVNPGDDVFSGQQVYLDPSPVGIDARWAWTQTYGSGASVGFVDLEQGWFLAHEDLPPIVALPGVRQDVNPGRESHGTAVLGIVAGVDNAKGIIGIAPTPDWVSVASHFRGSDATEGHVTDALTAVMASGRMKDGDVLLLEVLAFNEPIELDPAVFSAIQLAVALGIVVVEAAGNLNLDLDLRPSLDRNNTGTFTDSGAIVVGAGMSALDATGTGHDRWVLAQPFPGSNFGSRVDCHAYGDKVVTAGPTPNAGSGLGSGTLPTNKYRSDFGGTSAAAAIVAGAAVVLQGLHRGVKGTPLSPAQMRDALSTYGTPQGNGQPGHIGVMPDLRQAAQALGLRERNISVPSGEQKPSVPEPPRNLRIQS